MIEIPVLRHRFVRLTNWPGPVAWLVSIALGLMIALAPLGQVAVLLGALAIVLLALMQPLTALALALFLGPLGALENVVFGGLPIDSGQTLLVLALATWIGGGLLRRRFSLPRSPLTIPLFIFIAAGTLSLIGAPDPVLGIKEVIKWIEIAAVMLMVMDLGGHLGSSRREQVGEPDATNISGIWWIVATLLLAGSIQALIGIWQFALRGEGPEHFLVLGKFYRAYGTFEQPNPFGGFMNMTVLLALGVLIGLLAMQLSPRDQSAHRRGDSQIWPQWLLITSAVFAIVLTTILGLLFSWSRGAWMGFAAGVLVMIVFLPRHVSRGFVALGIGLVLLVVALQAGLLPETLLERVGGFAADLTFGDVRGVDINDENYSVLERLAHWQAALAMAREQPWLGIGFGNYAAAYGAHALINWPDALGHAHNYYLNLLAETGIAGLIAYLFLWGAIYWQTLHGLNWQQWPVRGVLLGLLGVWTAVTVHHLVDKLYVNNIYIHLGALLGLLQLSSLRGPRKQSGRHFLEAS